MATPIALSPHRVQYLETIRGVAALQVLLLHAFSAFAPALVVAPLSAGTLAAYLRASPLFLLYDGYSAVYVFFILSGYVLTRSFEAHPAGMLPNLSARIARLGMPALAACAVSACLYWPFAGLNVEAGRIVGSAWFARLWQPDLTLGYFVKDAILNALLLGYQDVEGIGLFAAFQDPVGKSFVSPLWSLSWEFWGSVLTFALVMAGRGSRGFRIAALVLIALYVSRSALVCFVAGHLAARFGYAERSPLLPRSLAWALLATGIASCVAAENWQPEALRAFCDWSVGALYPGQGAYLFQKILGAILICAGLAQSTSLRSLLGQPRAARWAQLSFPLYLVHWPILFGPSAALFLIAEPRLGIAFAQMLAIGFAVAASLLAAWAFAPIDRAAVRLSRALRRWRMSGPLGISAAAPR